MTEKLENQQAFFVTSVRQGGVIPEKLAENFGNDLYVGRKE